MSTKREPLLSDEEVDFICEQHPYSAQLYAKRTAMTIILRHEAARAKDAELIQRLVDFASHIDMCASSIANSDHAFNRMIDRAQELVESAESAGFTPSQD